MEVSHKGVVREVVRMAKAWTRWQDWAEVVLGVVIALSTLVVSTSTAAAWTMAVLGVLVALDGLWSLAAPGMVAGEWIQLVLGVLLFIAPWVMGYTAMNGAAWTSWVGGVLTVVLGAIALPVANLAHKGMAGSH
ncbi:hypothetical protein KALB_7554 [Kutzneria albida DSM 43870]|uniref:SPW repeat-containing integral membrane domain-containing protein n=2 Tax=Kutzneria TaxID=43356 RepID=W5WK08_9PSEU|nr:hypothetical protein KALB_7554 [Kutzneria albida DSM 43870]